jgi:hypothetical protein
LLACLRWAAAAALSKEGPALGLAGGLLKLGVGAGERLPPDQPPLE